MIANVKAAELKTKLFNLINEFKSLQLTIHADAEGDLAQDAVSQIDQAATGLAGVYENLGDLFVDAHRDTKDQSFAFAL